MGISEGAPGPLGWVGLRLKRGVGDPPVQQGLIIHAHPGSPQKALSEFCAHPESRPPTGGQKVEQLGGGGVVIYIHNQARGLGCCWEGWGGGPYGWVGGQVGQGHLEGVCRMGRGEQAQGGLRNSLWPIGKKGLAPAVPAPSTGAYGGGGGGGGGRCGSGVMAEVRRPQVLEDDHQWWKLRNRSGQAGYVPGNILAETGPEDALLEQVRRSSARQAGWRGVGGAGARERPGPEPGPLGSRGWCGGSPAPG